MTRSRTPMRSRALKALASLTLAAVTVTAASTAAAQQNRVRFQLDWRFEGPGSLFVMGQCKGFYKDEGLDVVIDAGNGSAGTVNRVASGAYDMGFADIGAMIEFLAANQHIPAARLQAVYMVYDATPAAVFALKKSGITKPSDLNGKKMGAPVFDAGRKTFPIFAKATGLDASKFNWQSMDPPLRETMLARGEVDAITGFYFTSLLNLNARGVKDEDVVVLKYPDYGVRIYGNAILANPGFIEKNPEAIRKFLRAFTRSAKAAIEDNEGAIKCLKERDALLDEALERRRLKLAVDMVIATPEFKANGIGAVNKVRLEETVEQTVSAFGLKTPVNADMVFNSSFLPSRGERQIFSK